MTRPATPSRRALVALALALAATCAPRALAWGFTAHRMVNAKAAGSLPQPLRGLFERNLDELQAHSVDPDLWRAAGDESEGPAHYLDMDAFGEFPFPELTPDEAEHRRRHGAEAARQGRVPWRAAEQYAALVAAFRQRDAAAALRQAAILGHYAGDAHVPLHAVLNYDGQLSGQEGVHGRWESELVERFERQLEPLVQPAAARPAGDPATFVLAALRSGFAHAREVLASDLAARGPRDLAATPQDERYDDGYYSRLFEREGPRLASRLTEAAEATGALWLQAWSEAGRPQLDWSYRVPRVRGHTRALFMTLDGASPGAVGDALRRGLMPNLARLRERGATAHGTVAPMPVKTAAAHAALFTGAWSDVNGIAGNSVPRPGGSILEADPGFPSQHLKAEPIWVTAARQGLPATVVTATQVYPFAPFLAEKRFGGHYGRNLTLMDGFQGQQGPEGVLTAQALENAARPAELPPHAGEVKAVALGLAGVRLSGLLYDDPADPAEGFDTLALSGPRNATRLKPAPAGAGPSAFGQLVLPLPAGDAAVFLRLFELSSDGSRLLLYHTAPSVLRTHPAELQPLLLQATGGFVPGSAAHTTYARGQLGPRLWEGGDGTAEQRFLETMALSARQLGRLTEAAARRTDWSLLVTYLPFPDEFSHHWLGFLAPGLPGHDPALAARLRPFWDRGMALIDEQVGLIEGLAGPDTIVALAGDHGQAPVHRVARPNAALRAAGLLSVGADGQVDLARTRALYFLPSAGYVLLNKAARPGGVVAPGEEAAVIAAVRRALTSIRDPRTGERLVLDVLDARSGPGPFGLGGPNGGDLYLSVAPGTDLEPALDGPPAAEVTPYGAHILDPARPEMQALFVVAGPGVEPGDLGVIRHVDVAPTLCELLGLDPPAQAVGRALGRALAQPPRAAAAER